MTEINQLQEAIIELVPEIKDKQPCFQDDDGVYRPVSGVYRDITLADCVQAIKKMGYNSTEEWRELQKENVFALAEMWECSTDALHLQKRSTINFLHDVICQEK